MEAVKASKRKRMKRFFREKLMRGMKKWAPEEEKKEYSIAKEKIKRP